MHGIPLDTIGLAPGSGPCGPEVLPLRLLVGPPAHPRVAARKARREIVLQIILGAAVTVLIAIILVDGRLRRTGRRFLRAPSATPAARRAIMVAIGIVALVLTAATLIPTDRLGYFAFCGVCPVKSVATDGVSSFSEFLEVFLLAAWYYAATVLPIFALACLLSGVIAVRSDKFRISGVVPSFVTAAVLPICSCGVVPIVRGLLASGRAGAHRDAVVFLTVAPLLSPVVVLVGLQVLGGPYVIFRVVGSAVVAAVAVAVVAPMLAGRVGDAVEQSRPPASSADSLAEGSVFLTALNLLTSLGRYVLYGVGLGALFIAALPPTYVSAILRRTVASIAATVVVGVPINMCGGEEILIAGPLAGMGFTMGHAIAFSLASTGVCVSALPLWFAVLGRKATLTLVAIYVVVPFLLGLAINAVPVAPPLGPAPF